MDLVSTGLLDIPGRALPASHAPLEYLSGSKHALNGALISYLGRSSVRHDNKPYLISPCSLMSQLKGACSSTRNGARGADGSQITSTQASGGLGANPKPLVSSHRRFPRHIGRLLLSRVEWPESHTAVGGHRYTQRAPQ